MNRATISAEAEILSRVIGPKNASFTPDVDRSVLEMRFTDTDTNRMNELATKSRGGSLSEEEQEQLHAYLFVGALLDLMHSKARPCLKQADG